jgi:hypothetical protein
MAHTNALHAAFWPLATLCAVLSLAGCGCPTAYRYDGGATLRPYYKVELCPNQRERILCDSPTRLPNPGVCQ